MLEAAVFGDVVVGPVCPFEGEFEREVAVGGLGGGRDAIGEDVGGGVGGFGLSLARDSVVFDGDVGVGGVRQSVVCGALDGVFVFCTIASGTAEGEDVLEQAPALLACGGK